VTQAITDYCGTYTGFSPTDESPCQMGEIQIVVSENGITFRHATGHTVQEETVPLNQVRALSPEEVRAQFNPDFAGWTEFDGFKVGAGAVLLFSRSQEQNAIRLIVRRGELADMLAPTFLFDETQVDAGLFDTALKAIEVHFGPNVLPRIKHGGRIDPNAPPKPRGLPQWLLEALLRGEVTQQHYLFRDRLDFKGGEDVTEEAFREGQARCCERHIRDTVENIMAGSTFTFDWRPGVRRALEFLDKGLGDFVDLEALAQKENNRKYPWSE